MAEIGHGYGSECHMLRYLGRHREQLDAAVREAIGCEALRWRDFPFDRKSAWKDGEWKGLDFLPANSPARAAWAEFWPQRGNPPNWDAVGTVSMNGTKEWLLVEAKAHLGEIRSSCQASPKGGLETIRTALDATKQALGVAPERDWLSDYYQACNRHTVLNFLVQHDTPARLLFIYFTGDSFPDGSAKCPQSAEEWTDALAEQAAHIGLPQDLPLADRIHTLIPRVCP